MSKRIEGQAAMIRGVRSEFVPLECHQVQAHQNGQRLRWNGRVVIITPYTM